MNIASVDALGPAVLRPPQDFGQDDRGLNMLGSREQFIELRGQGIRRLMLRPDIGVGSLLNRGHPPSLLVLQGSQPMIKDIMQMRFHPFIGLP